MLGDEAKKIKEKVEKKKAEAEARFSKDEYKALNEEEKDLNTTLNDTINFLDPDRIHLEDELPEVLIKEKSYPDFNNFVNNQINAVINQLNIQEVVEIMGSKMFKIYMEAIEKKYDKSNLAMLKNALKNSKIFIIMLKRHGDILNKCYNRYAKKIDKYNEKKDARKKQQQINKLTQQKKKQMTGCLMQKIPVENYEDCLKNANKESAKYASSFLPKDAIIDKLIEEKINQKFDNQANALMYDLFKKKSTVSIPQGKMRQYKDNPGNENINN